MNVVHADEFLEPEQAFQATVSVLDEDQLLVGIKVAPGYYLYKESLNATLDATPLNMTLPVAEEKYDENFGKVVQVYHQPLVQGQIDVKGTSREGSLVVHFQGCADAGLCYPPMDETFTLSKDASGKLNVQRLSASDTSFMKFPLNTRQSSQVDTIINETDRTTNVTALWNENDEGVARYLTQASLWQIVLICFALGVMLSVTPCVLPMLPILLSIIVGKSSSSTTVSAKRGFGVSAAYVLGVSLVYTLLGVLAAAMGASLSIWLQNPWVLGTFAVILVVFALAMFDVLNLQMPVAVQNLLNKKTNTIKGHGVGQAFVVGLLSALVLGPCVAAPMAGVLLFIAQTQSLLTGALALFFLAWGQGALLLLLGIGAGRWVPKTGQWMYRVKAFCGLLLLATALWLAQAILPSGLSMILWAALCLGFAICLGLFESIGNITLWRLLSKVLSLLFVLWAFVIVIGYAAGGRDALNPLSPLTMAQNKALGSVAGHLEFNDIHDGNTLNQVLQQEKIALVDFYADWCVACIEMEKYTFTDPRVEQMMRQMKLYRIDMTDLTQAHMDILKQYRLFGPPAILIFKEGKLVERVIGFKNAQDFASILQRALNKN
ncbi:hypothetical protein IX83_08620 [Basilea psittacipulmonis DSM 24701]|uniref:Thioredoxin domain-containing protein n=4 Tax=Basilea TaxID=1472344 RepID=A0A077DF03_9BURK|nr:hypothetical protein IX83_08620 [Basilea psittacipulmonis DSM 24701]